MSQPSLTEREVHERTQLSRYAQRGILRDIRKGNEVLVVCGHRRQAEFCDFLRSARVKFRLGHGTRVHVKRGVAVFAWSPSNVPTAQPDVIVFLPEASDLRVIDWMQAHPDAEHIRS